MITAWLIDSKYGLRGISRGFVQVFLLIYACVFFLGVPNAYDNLLLEDPLAARQFLLGSLSVIPVVTCSAIGFLALIRRRSTGAGRTESTRKNPSKKIMWACVILGTAIFAWYLWQTRRAIPLIDTLRGANPTEATRLRRNALADLKPASLATLFQYTRDFLLPTAAAFSFIGWLSTPRLRSGVLAIVTLSIAALSAVATLEKSPLINLALMLGAIFAVAPNRPPRWLIVSLIGVCTTGVFLLTKLTNASDRTFGNLVEGLYRRVVLGPAAVASEYFAWAPKVSNGYLRGSGLPLLHNFSSRGTVDVPREIYRFMRPAETTPGSANGAFHAMAWVEFGWIGVIASAACVGIILVGIGVLIERSHHSEVRLVAVGLTTVAIMKAVSTSLNSSLFGVGLGYVDSVAIILIIDWFASRRTRGITLREHLRRRP
jgi:hypothetical protein